jgi:hypothetical protein
MNKKWKIVTSANGETNELLEKLVKRNPPIKKAQIAAMALARGVQDLIKNGTLNLAGINAADAE